MGERLSVKQKLLYWSVGLVLFTAYLVVSKYAS